MKSYFTLLRQILPYKKLIFWFGVFSILTVLFSLVSLVLLVPFLELLFDKTELILSPPTFQLSKDYFIDTFYYYLSTQIQNYGKVRALAFFCIIVCIVFLLKNLFRYAALFVLAPLRNQLIYDLRDRMYKKVLMLPISFFQKEKKGEFITKFTSDLTEIEYSIMNTLETSIQSPLTIILFLGAMLSMSAKLTLFVFAMILVMAVFIGRIGKSLKKESSDGKRVLSNLTSVLDETIGGIKIIQAYFVQHWIYQKFRQENKLYFDTYNRMYRKRDLSSPLTEFLAIIVVCIVLWFGGQIVLGSNELSASTFISFMVVFSQLIPPAKSFSSAIYEIKKGMASYERIQTILNAEEITLSDAIPQKLAFVDKLEFQEVDFQYDTSEKKSIRKLSVAFEKGKKYAIVGASGAGKTTFLDLLLGFYSPTSGNILLDHVNIKNLSLESYRRLFGFVSQDPILFNYSIAENIAFDDIEVSKINQALKIGNASDFAHRMQNIPIGERGSQLSGGERQRLTIARVAYRDPEIILMDEATSALDSQNENEVQKALEQLMKNKTSIVIAHRLSTIIHSDEILLMHEGEIIAKGTHDELYHSTPMYKRMVDLQNLG